MTSKSAFCITWYIKLVHFIHHSWYINSSNLVGICIAGCSTLVQISADDIIDDVFMSQYVNLLSCDNSASVWARPPIKIFKAGKYPWLYWWRIELSYRIQLKSSHLQQNGRHLENYEILQIASCWHRIWTDHSKMLERVFLCVTASKLTSQCDLKIDILYAILNEFGTFQTSIISIFPL